MPFESAFSQLFTQNTIIAWVVFWLVVLFMAGAMGYSRYRARRGRGPLKLADANKLELGYVGALVGMVVFLVISSFSANAKDYPDPPKPAASVTVTGFQWCWRFHYEGTSITTTVASVLSPLGARTLSSCEPTGRPTRSSRRAWDSPCSPSAVSVMTCGLLSHVEDC